MRDEQTALCCIFGSACYQIATVAPRLHITAFNDRELTELEEELDIALSGLKPLKDRIAHQRRALERRAEEAQPLPASTPYVPKFP